MPLLRVAVDCGEDGEELRLEVVMVGEQAREAAKRLRSGQELGVSGRLRAVQRPSKSGLRTRAVEVLATEIRPAGS